MKNKPLVSIMIPNYNHSKYLEECIESALNQTYGNIEIVILDNMSQDNSVKVASKYSDRGVKVCRNMYNILNRSYRVLANTLTSGKYMMLLCADDYIAPDFIEKSVNIMEKYPDVGYVHGERDFILDNGQILELNPFFNCSFIAPGLEVMPIYMVTTIAHPSQGVFRREAFDKIGGYDLEIDHMNADKALWYYLSYDYDYAYIREKMSFIRIGSQTETFLTQTNFQHPILCHLTLKDFISFAKRHQLDKVLARENEAFNILSREFLGYAAGMIMAGNWEKASAYLDYASVVKRDIIKDGRYIKLCDVVKTRSVDEDFMSQFRQTTVIRKRNYNPPEGYKEIKAGDIDEQR